MTSDQLQQMDNAYVLPTYARFDLCLEKGKGCHATTPEGKLYLDFTSGIGVNSLGWCDEEWQRAIAIQAATLQHTSNLFYTSPGAQLAEELCKRTGMAKVFFANSGAEANECAIKAARKYSIQKYGEGRKKILSLQNSFHGRTMATISATGQEAFHQHFSPFLPGFAHVPANDIGALKTEMTPDVCAVLVEPIQGEGGILPLETTYLQELQRLCRQRDILLIADEVQCGVGRTGHFLASEISSIIPDIITLAKGLGGGLPIGAALFANTCSAALGRGDHGSTFGANPVCCAGALVVVRRLNRGFLEDVSRNGKRLKEGLLALPGVAEVSGQGLMLGIRFVDTISASDVQKSAMDAGLLCLLAKDKLRLLPPLVIAQREIEEGLSTLKTVMEAFA